MLSYKGLLKSMPRLYESSSMRVSKERLNSSLAISLSSVSLSLVLSLCLVDGFIIAIAMGSNHHQCKIPLMLKQQTLKKVSIISKKG